MKKHTQTVKLTAVGGAVALALMQLMGIAHADSAVGQDTSIGNALNPRPVDPVTYGGVREEDGMGTHVTGAHTPTGQLYEIPVTAPEAENEALGWKYQGHVEIGGIHTFGDDDARDFKRYKDVDSGLLLNNFGLAAENDESANYLEITGGGVGRGDQFYSLRTGKYNSWSLKGFYNETTHVFTTTYRNLWNGVGTDSLTLKPSTGLQPGGTTDYTTTNANLRNAVLGTSDDDELSLIRKKGGVRLDVNLTDTWKVYTSFTNEKREGARPFGMVMGGGGGASMIEIPESIDYDTSDIVAGLQFSNELSSFNAQVSASMFRNNIDTLTVQNPLYTLTNAGLPAGSFTTDVFDLYPDNNSYNAKAEYARQFPELWKSKVTAVASYTSNQQNDKLIPYTPYSGATYTGNGVAGGAWDTTASLSQKTAKAEIDTTLLNLGLNMQPVSDLDVKGVVRYYKTENSTEYWACNPLTGAWGRLLNDGSGSAIITGGTANGSGTAGTQYLAAGCDAKAAKALGLVPANGNTNIRNIPYEYTQMNYTLGGDYRLTLRQSINASYERETYDREHRERDQTWEDKLKLGYVNRAITDSASLRGSVEFDQRRGSKYNPDPYEDFYSAYFGGEPTVTPASGSVPINATSWIHVNDLHRKFDLADRDQNILNLRWNQNVMDNLDFGVSGQVKDIKYPDAKYGRGSQSQNTVNFDMNWQASNQMSVFGFYSYQGGQMKQQGVQQNACNIGATYYFYGDGHVETNVATAPNSTIGSNTPTAGYIASQTVTAQNFQGVCGGASATSPLYPTSRGWDVTQDETNHVLGVGLKYDFGFAQFDVDYTVSLGTTKISYDYNGAALGLSAAVQEAAGNGFEDLKFNQHSLNANLLVPVTRHTAVRVLYRLEYAQISDWHYEGVAANPVPTTGNTASQVYLDAGPQDYTTQFVGMLLSVKF